MAAVGVDACRTGWIAVALRTGQPAEAHFLPTIDGVTAAIPDARAIGVDIPIGLPADGRRRADVEARAWLGPRRSSVFYAPVREALEASTHAAATAASLERTGSGLSQQAYALAAKIIEVERWLPHAPCEVFEVHPEISFSLLIGAPAGAPKKTWAGMVERRAALTRAGIELDHITGPAARSAAVDDMLDAAAAAWSAARLVAGRARSFPEAPETDHSGRPVAIWA